MIDRFQGMSVFVRVAQAGSFAGAGRDLNMSAPSITRIVASLEDSLGTRLFVRTTRSIKLTEAGLRYLEDCRRILDEMAQAEAAVSGSFMAAVGSLTVSAPVLFGRLYVMPILTAFLERHPKVTGRALFVDRMTSLVDEGIDVAVRIGHLSDASYVAAKVGSVRRIVCAAPDYLRRRGVPATPADLARHRTIGVTSAWSAREWRLGPDSDVIARIAPTLTCNTNDAAIAAAVDGFGLVRVPSYQIADDLRSGRLEAVLEEYEEPALPVHVVYADRTHAPAKVRLFVDLAVERLRGNPAITGGRANGG